MSDKCIKNGTFVSLDERANEGADDDDDGGGGEDDDLCLCLRASVCVFKGKNELRMIS